MVSNLVKINLRICDYLCCYQFLVFIYDSNNKLVCKQTVRDWDSIDFYPPYIGTYAMKVIVFEKIPKVIYKTSFYYGKSSQNCISFILPSIRNPILHPITIKMTDQNYRGLPIMKGEIKLWQNHI